MTKSERVLILKLLLEARASADDDVRNSKYTSEYRATRKKDSASIEAALDAVYEIEPKEHNLKKEA